jgi:hypothetical protein
MGEAMKTFITHFYGKTRLRGDEPRRGQSFVEFALTLPMLLLILAGVLEVGNILTMYNRLQIAVREGARFGAAGGTDEGVREIVSQASEGSLTIAPDQMTIWVVRPVVDTGGSPWQWEGQSGGEPWGAGVSVDCVYGDNCANPPALSDAVLADLQQVGTGSQEQSIDGSRMVIVMASYRAQTMLNLPFFQIPGEVSGRVPLSAYGVMVQEIEQETVAQLGSGCSSYALAIERQWLNGLEEGDTVDMLVINDLVHSPFLMDHWGFVAWRYGQETPNYIHGQGVHCLAGSHQECGSMWFPGTSLADDLGFLEYNDNPEPDTDMQRGDWVIASRESVAAANQPLIDHMTTERVIRVLVYDHQVDADGSITGVPGTPINPGVYRHTYGHTDNPPPPAFGEELWMYRIDDFALVKIVDFFEGEAHNWVTFEFIRWDNSCGYDLGT